MCFSGNEETFVRHTNTDLDNKCGTIVCINYYLPENSTTMGSYCPGELMLRLFWDYHGVR